MRRLLPMLLLLGVPTLARAQDRPEKPAEAPPGPVSGFLDTGGHATPVGGLAFTPDGQKLISIELRAVHVWDTVTGERERTWRLPTALDRAVVAPNGKVVAVAAQIGDWDGKSSSRWFSPIWLLNLETGHARLIRPPIDYDIISLAFSPDGQRLAWGTWYQAGVWDLKANRTTHLLGRFEGTVEAVQFDRDGTRLLTSGATVGKEGPSAQVWDVTPPDGGKLPVKPQRPLFGLAGAGEKVVWAPDGSRFADWKKGEIRLWTADGQREKAAEGGGLRTIALRDEAKPHALRFLDADRLAVLTPAAHGLNVRVVNVAAGKLGRRRDWPLNEEAEQHTAISADGKLVAATRYPGNQAVVFDVAKQEERRLGRAYPNPWGARWGPDSRSIAWGFTPHADDLARGLNLTTLAPRAGKQLEGFKGHWKPKGWEVVHEAADKRASKTRGLTLIHDGQRIETKIDSPAQSPTFYKDADGKLRVVVLKQWGNGDLFTVDAETGKETLVAWGTRGEWASVSPDGRFLLLVRRGMVMDVYRIEGKPALLLKVFVAGPDWAAWTPDGYYAATPGGERMMGWTTKKDYTTPLTFYPAERFRKVLYRPDVIRLVLEKGSARAALNAADAALGQESAHTDVEQVLPPRAALEVVDRSALPKVKLKATAEAAVKGQPVKSLRLLVDGHPLPDGQGTLELKQGQEKAEAEWTVTLPPGEHELKALARSPDTAGLSAAVVVPVPVPAAAPRPALHVIAVGIDKYPQQALQLKCAVADATGLAEAFGTHCAGPANLFGEVRATTLLDAKAEKDAVLAALKKAREAVRPGDLLVFSFAGHGVKQGKQFYLLTVNADPDKLADTALSGDELRAALADMPCQVLLLLDACHSAAGVRAFIDEAARGLTDDEMGVAVLCAAMGYEEAQEKDGHGLFTRAVLQALGEVDGVPYNRHDHRQYVHHLGAFVQDEVKELSHDEQHPFLTLPYVTESFPIRQLTIGSAGGR
jgi:hypothetical protein